MGVLLESRFAEFLIPPFWKWISFFLPSFPPFLPSSFSSPFFLFHSLTLSLSLSLSGFCFVNLWVNNRICQMLEMMFTCGMLLISILTNVEDTPLNSKKIWSEK